MCPAVNNSAVKFPTSIASSTDAKTTVITTASVRHIVASQPAVHTHTGTFSLLTEPISLPTVCCSTSLAHNDSSNFGCHMRNLELGTNATGNGAVLPSDAGVSDSATISSRQAASFSFSENASSLPFAKPAIASIAAQSDLEKTNENLAMRCADNLGYRREWSGKESDFRPEFETCAAAKSCCKFPPTSEKTPSTGSTLFMGRTGNRDDEDLPGHIMRIMTKGGSIIPLIVNLIRTAEGVAHIIISAMRYVHRQDGYVGNIY
ncbi:unnamed protein product [Protopolystoma xenopodis]|uniref:Uncharacterized protein n=1 Tax=Protopolystoma xenopodis TaxID=117903 RepID=A0A3S5AG32_9PLAT|nr:unnamed protein product [Protopolystoma xenopodis]